MLEVEKTLLQAWSFAAHPWSFPFLLALVSKQDEPWIYTGGIGLVFYFLQTSLEELLLLLKQVILKLDVGIEKQNLIHLKQST